MFEIIDGGFGLTIQDYPGRVGYWNVGIPPSGPMDSLAFRIANRIVGNSEDAAGLEITAMGPTIFFHEDATVAFAGASFAAQLDGVDIPWWTPVQVKKGSTIKIGLVSAKGLRAYMAIKGGIDVPLYWGSRSTFLYGKFGGFQGRPLKKGDIVEVFHTAPGTEKSKEICFKIIPEYTNQWKIGVISGPHGSPDFFTSEFEDEFFNTDYKVDYNANRLGIRLQGGAKPTFARTDGGEGGAHPSNLHDYTYAIGTLNFSGDTPIIIGVDGPSLGGFISFVTIPSAELWKTGQLKPNDTVRFHLMTMQEALSSQQEIEKMIELI